MPKNNNNPQNNLNLIYQNSANLYYENYLNESNFEKQ